MNIANLRRQHTEVGEVIKYIKKEIINGTIQDNAGDIAKNISFLAGKLKIHLGEEDRSLYPSLQSSENEELKKFGKTYYDEMDGILEGFNIYKEKYNTRTKILNSIGDFQIETNKVISLLKNRINKEDTHLYPLLEKL